MKKPHNGGGSTDRRTRENHIPLIEKRRQPRVGFEAALAQLSEPSEALQAAAVLPVALELGMRIKSARLRKGLTQAQLAERASISQPALSDIENGKGKEGPNYATLKPIAAALDVELFSYESHSDEALELRLTARSSKTSFAAFDHDLNNASAIADAWPFLRDCRDAEIVSRIKGILESKYNASKLESKFSALILNVCGKGSVQLPVEPALTLVFNSENVYPSANMQGKLEIIRGTDGETFAMINTSGILNLQNHGGKSTWIVAVPPETFYKNNL
jgi:transcriptional regulator with XRE-family HTH domain